MAVDSLAERLAGRLQADPNDAEAYGALKSHYRDSGDLASLANLIEGWAAYQTDPVQASQGYLETARVVASSGKHSARQRELLKRATQLHAANREAVLELSALLSQQDDAHALAEFLDQHLRVMEEQPEDPLLMAALYARLGSLWNAAFERADVARRCYERALELDPADAGISAAARKLAEDTGDRALLARICALEAAAQVDPARKVQLYLQQADLCSALSDLDGAVQALRAALSSAPAEVGVMHQLASALSRRAAKLSPEEAARDFRKVAELHYQIAEAVAPEDALDYLEAALAAAPDHDGALHLMEQLAERLGRSELLPKYWLGYLAHASEGPELDQRRMSMAAVYAEAGQLDDAIVCLEQVRTEGLAVQALSELKARRGPRPASQAPGAARDRDPTEAASDTAARIDRPTAKLPSRPRVKSSERPLDIAPVVNELRRSLRDAIAARRTDEVIKACREILELEPGDAEAFSLLESHYRKTRDHARLRELLLLSTQISGVPIEVRKQRLREVAAISEAKLKDVEGAIEVWRNVVALDPADADASKSLKRLLQRTARWDELAGVLEHEALAAQSAHDKVELLGQIAAIHRDKRKDLVEAAAALRQLLALRPDPATRDELCDMLLSIENYADAVPLLQERALEASGEREQLRLWRLLAETLESKLADAEGAYQVYQRIQTLRPKDSEVLERMQRIDEQSGNAARLLDTLERRSALALRTERAALYTRMAEIADEELDDVDRAAGYYSKAFELDPAREGVLDALSHMFERKQRYADLAELLKHASTAERDPIRRSDLQLRRARVLRESLAQPAEAAVVYREVLHTREHPEALEFLLETARQQDDAETVAALGARLAAISSDPETRRALLYERAQVLVTELGRPLDAIRALREIVESVDPDFEPAIDWLAELCANLGDKAGLACALMRRLAKAQDNQDNAARVTLAQRLADLYELELNDRDNAITALLAWAKADPREVAPQRRLRPLLEAAGRFAELVATCDALALLEPDIDARNRATLDAAQIAFAQLAEADGAFSRLTPLVEVGLPEAVALLAVIARGAKRSETFAALCVRAAQEAKAIDIQALLWRAAVRTYAEDLANPLQALEAALRLLATDLKSREHLTQVEDCAGLADAWARLLPVYDRLLKSADSDAERVELLVRYAELLNSRANNASDALDRILHACTLAPDDETLMARAERLAQSSRRGADLLALCEHQAMQLSAATDKVDWLLRAARFAVSTVQAPERAHGYLAAALAATQGDAALWEQVVRAAGHMDATQDDAEPHATLRELVQAHRQIAEITQAPIGPTLILRGSRLLHDRLDDARGAFDLLRHGSGLFPLDENVYDALYASAEALNRFDALDVHLARAIDEALDPKSAAALLARRARLLEGPLGRPEDAADVFAKLLQLRPDDAQAAAKLRDSLRRARRFQDLLLVIHKQMQRVKNAEEKLELLKESAQVWELDLKNRWEALDAWRKVLEFAPQDAEARRAVVRLDRRSLPPAAADGHEQPEPKVGAEAASDDDDAGSARADAGNLPEPSARRVDPDQPTAPAAASDADPPTRDAATSDAQQPAAHAATSDVQRPAANATTSDVQQPAARAAPSDAPETTPAMQLSPALPKPSSASAVPSSEPARNDGAETGPSGERGSPGTAAAAPEVPESPPVATASLQPTASERGRQPDLRAPLPTAGARGSLVIDDLPSSEVTPLDDDELSVEIELASERPKAPRARRSTPPPAPPPLPPNSRRPGSATSNAPIAGSKGTPSGPPPLPAAATTPSASDTTPRRSLPPPLPPRKS
jgi:tetratricopeptide (TPR) repeat protein